MGDAINRVGYISQADGLENADVVGVVGPQAALGRGVNVRQPASLVADGGGRPASRLAASFELDPINDLCFGRNGR